MKITKTEFIGEKAKISCDGRLFEGTIVDETKNMIHLMTKKKVLRLIKKNITIMIRNEKIQGEDITKRPEERIKLC